MIVAPSESTRTDAQREASEAKGVPNTDSVQVLGMIRPRNEDRKDDDDEPLTGEKALRLDTTYGAMLLMKQFKGTYPTHVHRRCHWENLSDSSARADPAMPPRGCSAPVRGSLADRIWSRGAGSMNGFGLFRSTLM